MIYKVTKLFHNLCLKISVNKPFTILHSFIHSQLFCSPIAGSTQVEVQGGGGLNANPVEWQAKKDLWLMEALVQWNIATMPKSGTVFNIHNPSVHHPFIYSFIHSFIHSSIHHPSIHHSSIHHSSIHHSSIHPFTIHPFTILPLPPPLPPAHFPTDWQTCARRA